MHLYAAVKDLKIIKRSGAYSRTDWSHNKGERRNKHCTHAIFKQYDTSKIEMPNVNAAATERRDDPLLVEDDKRGRIIYIPSITGASA